MRVELYNTYRCRCVPFLKEGGEQAKEMVVQMEKDILLYKYIFSVQFFLKQFLKEWTVWF